MIKPRRLTVTTALQQLVSEDPTRTAFFVQHHGNDHIGGIFSDPEEPSTRPAIYLYPHCWFFFEKADDADKAWYIKSDVGTIYYIDVFEFYRGEESGQRRWL